MKFAVVAAVGLALVASCLALPVNMKNSGLELTPGNVNTWQKSITVGDSDLQLGLGFDLETMEASLGGKLVVKRNDVSVPIALGVHGPISDFKSQKFQLGVGFEQDKSAKFSGIVYSDMGGNVDYQVNAWAPLPSSGSQVGATLEASGLKPTSLTAGAGYGKETVVAKVGFNDKAIPSKLTIDFGSAIPSSIQ